MGSAYPRWKLALNNSTPPPIPIHGHIFHSTYCSGSNTKLQQLFFGRKSTGGHQSDYIILWICVDGEGGCILYFARSCYKTGSLYHMQRESKMSEADVENGDHVGLLAQKPNPGLKFDKKLSETERSTRVSVPSLHGVGKPQ